MKHMKHMKNKSIVLILTIAVMVLGCALNGYAAVTLDSLTDETVVIEETGGEAVTSEDITVYYEDDTSENYIDRLYDAVDHTGYNQTVVDIENKSSGVLGLFFQLITYVVTIGLTLRVLMDLMFILVPPVRCLFENKTAHTTANAAMPNRPAVNTAVAPLGSQSNGAVNGSVNGAVNGSVNYDKYWGVSEAAIRTVETSKGSKSGFNAYMKEMLVVSVFTGVLLVLAITGVLQQIGFELGYIIVNVLRGLF